jgi:hypothetical protein
MESNKEIEGEGTERAESKVRVPDSPQILLLARFVRLAVVEDEDPAPTILCGAFLIQAKKEDIRQLSVSAQLPSTQEKILRQSGTWLLRLEATMCANATKGGGVDAAAQGNDVC